MSGASDDAGLPGTYKAWLSSSTTSVRDRFDRDYDDAPFVRTDGARVANDWADLTDGTLLAAIDKDEFGHTGEGITDRVWTNTNIYGNKKEGSNDCNGWTSSDLDFVSKIGNVLATDAKWTDRRDSALGLYGCRILFRLYCFQQVSFWSEAEQPLPQFPTHRTTHTSSF